MTRKTPEWLRGRRDTCEERFSFLIAEFGYRRSLRRFRWGGFQLGYLGGAGVLVEWFPRDGVMVWLLPLDPGDVPANWGGPGGPKGFDLGFVAAAAGNQLEVRDEDVYNATDQALTALAGLLRASGHSMLRGDYAQVPAISDVIRRRAEAPRKGQLHPSPGGRAKDRSGGISAQFHRLATADLQVNALRARSGRKRGRVARGNFTPGLPQIPA